MPFQHAKPILFAETPETLANRLREIGQPAFRAKQILHWVYKKRSYDPAQWSNLPPKLREWVGETFALHPTQRLLSRRSGDHTDKLLLELEDRALIETVIIRAPQEGVGQENSRKTICISTQVGCAYGCRFCASGLAGFRRNLSTGEIVSQFLHVCDQEDESTARAREELASFDNVVVMGMGEPLANYDELLPALKILNADWGLHFGARRVTLSTSGLVPQIQRLAQEPEAFRLAVSLHGATNEVREQIMPVNRKYPLEKLIPAVREFARAKGRMVTLEYILIEDINDAISQAHELVSIARDVHAHVNLIPYNTVEGLPWRRPSLPRQQAFADILRDAHVSVTLRREKGHDINAACGQLRLKTEQKRESVTTSG